MKVSVITGASSGIGAALAKQLGAAGHQFVLAVRREKELKLVAAEEVAGTIVSLIEDPVPELYTNSALAQLAQFYYKDVGAFEERMKPRAKNQ